MELSPLKSRLNVPELELVTFKFLASTSRLLSQTYRLIFPLLVVIVPEILYCSLKLVKYISIFPSDLRSIALEDMAKLLPSTLGESFDPNLIDEFEISTPSLTINLDDELLKDISVFPV